MTFVLSLLISLVIVDVYLFIVSIIALIKHKNTLDFAFTLWCVILTVFLFYIYFNPDVFINFIS